MNETIKVKLDIAGFYFGYVFEAQKGTTLRAAMRQIEGRDLPTTNNTTARLNYGGNEKRFLDRIDVTFPNEAPKPRQKDKNGNDVTFPNLLPGVYAAKDETRVLTAAGIAELTWQYYVNAATFNGDTVDQILAPLNREPAGADKTVREVIPFGDFELDQDCLVTWRLIAIMVSGDPLPASASAA